MGEQILTVLHRSERSELFDDVMFFDSEEDPRRLAGKLVLITAPAEIEPSRLDDICRKLSESAAAGIVSRAGSDLSPSPLLTPCKIHNISLLQLDASIGWREFDALVNRVLGEQAGGPQLGASSGDKLFSLANTVAQTFQGSVAIEDHRRNILAYSALPGQAIDDFRASGILTRRTPDGPLNEIRYRQVFTAESVSRFPAEHGYAPRAAVPVRAGNITLGSIWVIDPEGAELTTPLTEDKLGVLLEAADLAAGYIVDAWRFEHGDERTKETALQRMISGTARENDATALGLRSEQRYLMLAIDCGPAADADLREIRTTTSRHLSVYFPGSVCTVREGRIIALLPSGASESARQSIKRFLNELEQSIGRHCFAGLTDPHPPGTSFVSEHETAVRVAQCAQLLNMSVALPDDVIPQLILQECGSSLGRSGLQLPETTALLSEAETCTTLLAWFEEQGNAPRVALRLKVHEQTVRYRVRQALKRHNLESASADRLLVLWLQLRLHELSAQHVLRA